MIWMAPLAGITTQKIHRRRMKQDRIEIEASIAGERLMIAGDEQTNEQEKRKDNIGCADQKKRAGVALADRR